MKKEVIRSSDAPTSPLFSQAVRVGNNVYLSGFTGIDQKTKSAGETIQEQTAQALQNCKYVLSEAKCTPEDVVQVIVLLRDTEDFAGMNEEYAKFFPTNPPARMVTKLGVSLQNLKISIAMTAFTNDE
jgi:2-iminobutanoate/2-iminopropanoate deaminase